MELFAILEFKVADRFFYNTSNNPLNKNGYIPIFETPEPLEKIASFIELLESKFPDHLLYETHRLKQYWILFNQGWELGRHLLVA